MKFKEKFAKAIRVLTTAPVFAFILCTLLYFLLNGAFASLRHYLAAVFFLTVLPVLAYPVAALIPPLRKRDATVSGIWPLPFLFSATSAAFSMRFWAAARPWKKCCSAPT